MYMDVPNNLITLWLYCICVGDNVNKSQFTGCIVVRKKSLPHLLISGRLHNVPLQIKAKNIKVKKLCYNLELDKKI